MEPTGYDLHDEIIAKLFVDSCPGLPLYEPARRMHTIDHEKLRIQKVFPYSSVLTPARPMLSLQFSLHVTQMSLKHSLIRRNAHSSGGAAHPRLPINPVWSSAAFITKSQSARFVVNVFDMCGATMSSLSTISEAFGPRPLLLLRML
jgi:hypothetical protein